MKKVKRLKLEIREMTLQNVERYIRSRGIKIRYYGTESRAHLESIGFWDYSQRVGAFIYVHDEIGYTIFINKTYSENQRLLALLHELAHIVLGHDIENTSQREEREADRFARECLSGKLPTWVVIAPIVTIAMCIVFFIIMQANYATLKPDTPAKFHEEVITEQPGSSQADVVYITPSGDRFHRSDCVYIDGKPDIVELSREKAVKIGKEPCKVCKP